MKNPDRRERGCFGAFVGAFFGFLAGAGLAPKNSDPFLSLTSVVWMIGGLVVCSAAFSLAAMLASRSDS